MYAAPGTDAQSDGNEATNPVTAQVWAEHSVNPQDPQLPRILAGGVTTMRTGGNVNGVMDITLARRAAAFEIASPSIDATAPYLNGPNNFMQMHPLKDPEDASRQVSYWAEMGATSFKAYMHITRAELSAAIDAAHKRGLKLTGHLCSITYREAAQLGIDAHRTDPLTHLALDIQGFARAVQRITELAPRIVALGGGGYDLRNVARGWTRAWAILNDTELPAELPAAFREDLERYEFDTPFLLDEPIRMHEDTRRRVAEYVNRQVSAVRRLVFPLHGM